MQTLRVNGYDMAYLEVGDGHPLVCVHGTLGDFRTWYSVLGPLSKAHRVISVSLRHFFPEHWDAVGAEAGESHRPGQGDTTEHTDGQTLGHQQPPTRT